MTAAKTPSNTFPLKEDEYWAGNPADHPSVYCWWVKPVKRYTGYWPQPKRLDDRWGHEVRTADGVEIHHGLTVITNDMEIGTIDLLHNQTWQENGEWWFYVSTDRGYVIQSESRVSTTDPRTGKKV